jgi:hypothetical protein
MVVSSLALWLSTERGEGECPPCHRRGFALISPAMLARLVHGRTGLHRVPKWLALVAMLVQFVASYGHLHPQDFNFLKHGHGPLTIASYNGPGGNGVDGTAVDTDCPICAAISLLGSSALPDGLVVPTPSAHGAILVAAFDAFHLAPPFHLLFDTRGPPQA